MDHPHVAALTDVYESEEQLFLVMDTWQGKNFWISRVDVDIDWLLMGGEFPMPLETFQECMQGGELFDRSWPCKLVPSDFLCFVFFTSFFSHLFFSMFLLYSGPIRLTEAWFPANSAILRSGAKETLHGKGCCSSYLSGNHPLKYPKHTKSVLLPPAWWWRKCGLVRFRKSFLEVIISQNLLFQMLLAVNYIHSHDIVTWLEAAVEA